MQTKFTLGNRFKPDFALYALINVYVALIGSDDQFLTDLS